MANHPMRFQHHLWHEAEALHKRITKDDLVQSGT